MLPNTHNTVFLEWLSGTLTAENLFLTSASRFLTSKCNSELLCRSPCVFQAPTYCAPSRGLILPISPLLCSRVLPSPLQRPALCLLLSSLLHLWARVTWCCEIHSKKGKVRVKRHEQNTFKGIFPLQRVLLPPFLQESHRIIHGNAPTSGSLIGFCSFRVNMRHCVQEVPSWDRLGM